MDFSGMNGIQWNPMERNAHWNARRDTLECVVGSVGVCGGKCWETVLGNVVRWKIVKRAAIIERFISQESEFNYQLSNDHVSLDQWLTIVDLMSEARVRFSAST